MTQEKHPDPRSVVPFYASGVHESFVLYEGAFKERTDTEETMLFGRITYEWLPPPSVAFDGIQQRESSGEALKAFVARTKGLDTGGRISLPENLRTIPPPSLNARVDLEGSAAVRSMGPVRQLRHGTGAGLHKVVFNLINFPPLERGVRLTGGDAFQAQAILSPWRLVIQNAPHAARINQRLHETGGFGFTHYCSLQRTDGEAFDFEDAEEVLELVFILLSFCRGTLVAPALPVGLDADDVARFAAWEDVTVDPARSCHSWFPHYEPDTLAQLFPLFWRRWQSRFWKDVLWRAIRMYVAANHASPVDTAIISGQVGLELLSWAILVEQEGWLNRTDGKLNAAGRLRLFLKWAGVNTDIPRDLNALTTLGKEFGLDGPGAAVWVRNRLVHPDKRDGLPDPDQMFDAWRLMGRYLELTILRIVGYSGRYVDRLTTAFAGRSEPVPWIVEA